MGTDKFIGVCRGRREQGKKWKSIVLLALKFSLAEDEGGGAMKGKEVMFAALGMGNRRESDPGPALQGPVAFRGHESASAQICPPWRLSRA